MPLITGAYKGEIPLLGLYKGSNIIWAGAPAVDVVTITSQLDVLVTIGEVTVQQALNDIVVVDTLNYTVDLRNALAYQSVDVIADVTTESYIVDLFDVTVTTEILQLPNLVPVADVAVNDWTVAPLWSKINTPGSLTTWITSSNANGSTARIRLSVPQAGSAAVLKFWRRKTTGNDPTFVWELFRNGVTIQTSSVILTTTTFVESQYPLTENLVAGATYEIVMTRSGGGNPQQRGTLEIASLYIDPV